MKVKQSFTLHFNTQKYGHTASVSDGPFCWQQQGNTHTHTHSLSVSLSLGYEYFIPLFHVLSMWEQPTKLELRRRSSSIGSSSRFHRGPLGETGRSRRDWVWNFQHHGESQSLASERDWRPLLIHQAVHQDRKLHVKCDGICTYKDLKIHRGSTVVERYWPTQANLASTKFVFLKELYNMFKTLQTHQPVNYLMASWDKTMDIGQSH